MDNGFLQVDYTLKTKYNYDLTNKLTLNKSTGARFSKVPVIYGPVNLPGHLSGSFIGPEVAFLEAPVNFPGTYRTYRGPEKIAGRYQTLARSRHGRPREKGNELELYFIRIIRFVRVFERTVFLRFDSKDNAICSKVNFGVVVVSKESNQEVIFMHYHIIYKR